MEKIKKYGIWIFIVLVIISHFMPKGAQKNYLSLASLIIIIPIFIIGIIKSFKENSKQKNTQVITDIVFISLIIFFFYLIRKSEY
jgi:membrane-bound acyltransferase YfiQ involved in biofilm formation